MPNFFDQIIPSTLHAYLPALSGVDVTLKRTVKGSYDPVTRVKGADVVTDHFLTSLTPLSHYTDDEINDTTIKRNDAQISISSLGLSIVPDALTETLQVAGVWWAVVAVARNNTGELDASYCLQLRK